MTTYDNNMRGVLFRNDKKELESHPDYKGQCEVEGCEFWLSAWVKTSNAGKKYMSLSFQAKEQQAGGGQPPQQTAASTAPLDAGDEDIPFAFPPIPLAGVDQHRGHANR